mmetsp:Transcript_34000/g.96328  ORF Transcript_34000/g.96328 Transcript_34000/m.96328 type:complete len:139 (+) Transcript_34000:345-761(+)
MFPVFEGEALRQKRSECDLISQNVFLEVLWNVTGQAKQGRKQGQKAQLWARGRPTFRKAMGRRDCKRNHGRILGERGHQIRGVGGLVTVAAAAELPDLDHAAAPRGPGVGCSRHGQGFAEGTAGVFLSLQWPLTKNDS